MLTNKPISQADLWLLMPSGRDRNPKRQLAFQLCNGTALQTLPSPVRDPAMIKRNAPHPSPLPMGEGAGCDRCNSVPLPVGEGQGEGWNPRSWPDAIASKP